MYDINWSRLIYWLLPHPLRNSVMQEWLLALLAPVVTVHLAFLSYRRRMHYSTKATGQVTKLRAYLNQLFDPLQKRIEIYDSAQGDFLYIYQENENKPIYLPTFLTGSAFQFVVFIPTEFKSQEQQIRAILNAYKLPTMKYYIIWI